MKRFLVSLLAAGIFAVGCSRSDKTETSVKPQSTPDAEQLKADSERLQQATNKAAEQRAKDARANAQASPRAKPKGDASLLTVPPSPANPTP